MNLSVPIKQIPSVRVAWHIFNNSELWLDSTVKST